MKAIILSSLGILALVGVLFSLNEKAEAQPSNRYPAAPGTPPVGCVCEVRVLASILSDRTEVEIVRGNLLSMTTDWVVLRDGSFENWVPREKVITLRASR